MSKTRVGIIGTGLIASLHSPAIANIEETELIAVLSRDENKGKDFLADHGSKDGAVYTKLEEFANDENINLIIVCSPDGIHAEQAAACLRAGKHVLIEKPMTLNEQDAIELVELAESNNLVLATGFHLRYHSGHRALYDEIVNRNTIGNIRHIRAIWAFPFQNDSNWRADSSYTKWWSLSAVGAHCIDLARWFSNDTNDWKSFSSTLANNLWNGDHDETAVIAAQTQSGPTVEVVSSVQFGPYNQLEIFGDKGSAICESTMGREGKGEIILNGEKLDFQPISPFMNQLSEIVKSIQNNSEPIASGRTGLRNVKDLLLAL